ncbi:MAG: precorrin-6y C5,15-methyltransferase (decarboxylating) subunit CbiE [Proteobacteria bacterium]|nr:precorrin-6y C5,15-methyltransferase (decarboxylating) subunit CbiE [Pseudomonadota bacterium]
MTHPGKIEVIGMDVLNDALSEKKQEMIRNADVVIGGRTQLDAVATFTGKTICITGDIQSLIDQIHQCLEKNQHIVVLATGDPLLFGIGNTLIEHFGKEAVTVHPGISSMQAALSRLGLRTDNAVILSRHGTHNDDLRRLLYHHTGVILTSNGYSPVEIIQEIIGTYSQAEQWQGHVCQCLGTSNETIQSGELRQLAVMETFQTPNLLVVENPSPLSTLQGSSDFGWPDDQYQHEAGLITHPEVRAVTLSKLRLGGAGVLWDVGAGSGSVGIEAAQLNPFLNVFSIEKNDQRYEHIIFNRKKHNVNNLFPVRGNASEVCLSLPIPDRVFLGGGGKALSNLLPLCYERLSENGVMVVNTVTIESFEIVRHFFKQIHKEIEVISLQVSRLAPLATYYAFKPDNPITLFGINK